jgi:hypothetical protein
MNGAIVLSFLRHGTERMGRPRGNGADRTGPARKLQLQDEKNPSIETGSLGSRAEKFQKQVVSSKGPHLWQKLQSAPRVFPLSKAQTRAIRAARTSRPPNSQSIDLACLLSCSLNAFLLGETEIKGFRIINQARLFKKLEWRDCVFSGPARALVYHLLPVTAMFALHPIPEIPALDRAS